MTLHILYKYQMIINVALVYFGVFEMGCVCTYSMLNSNSLCSSSSS